MKNKERRKRGKKRHISLGWSVITLPLVSVNTRGSGGEKARKRKKRKEVMESLTIHPQVLRQLFLVDGRDNVIFMPRWKDKARAEKGTRKGEAGKGASDSTWSKEVFVSCVPLSIGLWWASYVLVFIPLYHWYFKGFLFFHPFPNFLRLEVVLFIMCLKVT